MAEKLAEWRKARKYIIEAQDAQSKLDCQKMAILLSQKAMKEQFDPTYSRVGPWLNVSKNAGTCQWEHFVPIMQNQCTKTFGEKCEVVKDLGDWGDESLWGIKFK